MPHDQQTREQTERDCRNDEQIYRGDAVGMIAEERLPPLGRRTSSLGHVFSHARLSDRDVEFQQLSMDPLRSPQGVWRCSSTESVFSLHPHLTSGYKPAPTVVA